MIAINERPPVLTPPEPRAPWRTTSVIPYIRKGWVVDDNDLIEIETVAVRYDLESESAVYLARICGSVGTLSEFTTGDVVFSEGDGIRVRLLRQRHRIEGKQRRQCDETIEDLHR